MPEVSQKLYIHSDNIIQITGLENIETSATIDDAVVTMSLFEEVPLNIDMSRLEFDSGGTVEVAVDDIVEGDVSGATATVAGVVVDAGTWAGGDATGHLNLLKQFGTFQAAEHLDVSGKQANIASIASDSTSSETAAAGANTLLHITGHHLLATDYVRIQGTRNFDGEFDLVATEEGKIQIPVAFVVEKFTGNEKVFVGITNAVNISLSHVGGDAAGYYDGVLLSTIQKIVYGFYYYLFITITDLSLNVKVLRIKLKAIYSPET